MITVYQLDYLVDGKLVRFKLQADSSLRHRAKVDEKTEKKWRARLQAIAHCMFKERNAE